MSDNSDKLICGKCGQENNRGAAYCWACFNGFSEENRVDAKKTAVSGGSKWKLQPGNSEGIMGLNRLYLKQKKHLGEVLVNWEFVNQYEILDEKGGSVGRAEEQKRSLAHAVFIRRWGRMRDYAVTFFDRADRQLMVISRPVTFFGMSRVTVTDVSGKILGYIRRQFPPLIRRRYIIFDGQGMPLAEIKGSLIHLWSFRIFDMNSMEAGAIYKKWSGIGKEVFTDADTFLVEMPGVAGNQDLRKIILAASVMVDFDFFETSSSK